MGGIISFFFVTSSLADSLYVEKDYFRAITEYKRLLFCGIIDSAQAFNKISLCYANSHKYEKAGEYLSLAMQKCKEDTNPTEWSLRLAWYLLKSKKPSQARLVLDELKIAGLDELKIAAVEKLYAISYLCENNYALAKLYLDNQKYKCYDEEKIGLISTFLPGGGQIVIGNWVEGILSSLIVGGLGYFSYKNLIKKDYFSFIFTGSWFLRFYRGNIERTKQIVREKNNKVREKLEEEIEYDLKMH